MSDAHARHPLLKLLDVLAEMPPSDRLQATLDAVTVITTMHLGDATLRGTLESERQVVLKILVDLQKLFSEWMPLTPAEEEEIRRKLGPIWDRLADSRPLLDDTKAD